MRSNSIYRWKIGG